MKKVLVYVDAENITAERFHEFLGILEEDVQSDEMVIGKFYGNSRVLGTIITECYGAGFEFVDTSVLLSSKKNIADMKIAVDCIMDVMSVYRGDVERVYLVSGDHDFVPLAYKLTGQRIKVVSPFLEDAICQKTCTDLTKHLNAIGFNPVVQGTLLERPFTLIGALVGEEFSDELIRIYLEKKRKKIAKELMILMGSEVAEKILQIDIEIFDFHRMLQLAKPVDREEKLSLFNLYTKKMYGVCLPASIAMNVLGGDKLACYE